MYKILRRLTKTCFETNPPPLDDSPREDMPSATAVVKLAKPLIEAMSERGDPALVRSCLLIGHDHLQAAEKQLGKRSDPGAAYLHGIVQRRLGDYAKACFWFRQIGDYPPLLLVAESLRDRPDMRPVLHNFPHLIHSQRFCPAPMVGVIQQSCAGGHVKLGELIRAVQAIELSIMLSYTAGKDHKRAQQLAEPAGCGA